jgi:hypothetical protein
MVMKDALSMAPSGINPKVGSSSSQGFHVNFINNLSLKNKHKECENVSLLMKIMLHHPA